MTCQAPGTAWQTRWRRPRGSNPGSSAWAKTTPEVPIVAETTPGRTMPLPTAPGRLVAAAADDRRPRRQARSPPSPRALTVRRDLGALVARGQQSAGSSSSLPSSSVLQRRLATSSSSVPEASLTSVA